MLNWFARVPLTFMLFENILVIFSLLFIELPLAAPMVAKSSQEQASNSAALKKLAEQIELYLNTVRVMVSPFTQISLKNGRTKSESGTVYMQKFGKSQNKSKDTASKMLFKFNDQRNGEKHKDQTPQQIFVIGDKMFIKYKDKPVKVVSLKATPIMYIFNGNLKIREHFVIMQCGVEQSSNIVFLQLKPKFLKSAVVTLFFRTYSNGNIERFLGWSVSNGSKDSINVKLDESMVVNDIRALPKGVFDVSKFAVKKNK
ncbi:MAG: hypothetical protein LBF84_00235 [Holosporales bacterium]|jgi:hypothetical protein|nr:hypothetical protein [Holosporales bacterium]